MADLNGASLAVKKPLPKDIEKRMKQYRATLSRVPKEYIEFHKQIAQEVIAALATQYKFRVVETLMKNAGWFDGMVEMQVIVETKSGKLVKLVYNDSNQGFMRKYENHGGAGSFDPNELFV